MSFDGSTERLRLTTAPDADRTHWAQLRFLFAEPTVVTIGQKLQGSFVLKANPQSSYTAYFEAELDGQPLPRHEFGIHSYIWWKAG